MRARSPRRPTGQTTTATIPRPAGDPRSYSLAWCPAIADLLHSGPLLSHSAVINADRWPDETVLLVSRIRAGTIGNIEFRPAKAAPGDAPRSPDFQLQMPDGC